MYLTDANDTELGYWRKANAIHAWFVKHVQNGMDECERHEVPRKAIEQLKATCEAVVTHSKLVPSNVEAGSRLVRDGRWERLFEHGRVIEDPTFAMEHLPIGSGFFFGSTTYTERYLDSVKETVVICDKALRAIGPVFYQSSW